MQRPLSYYLALAKRWIWLVVLGIVICGGGTYVFAKFETPVYQATAVIVVNVSPTSVDNAQASIAAAPTYAQLVTNPGVLQPVLNMHPGMTLQQLTNMTTVSVATNTQLVDIDVQNSNPQMAAQLANQISQAFVQYSNTHFPGTLQVLPALVPAIPVKPRPLTDATLGALAGLGLAVALIFLFEWIENRFRSAEEVQQALDTEVLAVVPYIARRKGRKDSIMVEEPGLIEIYRTLCANLNAEQTRHPLKLILVSSAGAGDGKSNISVNTATFLARTGKRVLLVDADLHHPVLAQQFRLNNHLGLSAIFLEQSAQVRSLLNGQETSIPTLRVLTAGVLPPNPAELLQSSLGKQLFSYFSEEAPFDYIIFDAPPLLALADAQILASLAHATILVVDVDKTPRRVLLQAKRALKRSHTRIVGVVINKCRWPEYRNAASSYNFYYSGNVEGPQADTSLVMYAGTLFPDRPPETPPPTFMDGSSSGNDSQITRRTTRRQTRADGGRSDASME